MESPQFVNEENVINSIVTFFETPTNYRLDLFRALKLYNENDFLTFVSNEKIINNLLTDAPLYSICINLGEKLQPHGLAIYRYGIRLWVIRYNNPEYLETIDKKEERPTQKKFNMAIREHVSRKNPIKIAPRLGIPSASVPKLHSYIEFPELKSGKPSEKSPTVASMVGDFSDGEDGKLAKHQAKANHKPVEANHQDLLTFMEDKDLVNYQIHSGCFIKIPEQSSLNWLRYEYSKFDVQMKSITLNGVNGLQIQISATLPNGHVFFAGKYYIR